jgi:hypothetical protein
MSTSSTNATAATQSIAQIERSDTDNVVIAHVPHSANVAMQLASVKQEKNAPLPAPVPLKNSDVSVQSPASANNMPTVVDVDALASSAASPTAPLGALCEEPSALSLTEAEHVMFAADAAPVREDDRIQLAPKDVLRKDALQVVQELEQNKFELPQRRQTTDQWVMTLVPDLLDHFDFKKPSGGKFGHARLDASYRFAALSESTSHAVVPASSRNSFLGSSVDAISLCTAVKILSESGFGTIYFLVGSKLQMAECERLGISQDAMVLSIGHCVKGVVLALGTLDHIERVVTVTNMMAEEVILRQNGMLPIGEINRQKHKMVVHLQRRLNMRGVEINTRPQPEPQVAVPTPMSSNIKPTTDRDDCSLHLRLQAAEGKVSTLETKLNMSEGVLRKEKDKTATLKAQLDAANTISSDRVIQNKVLSKRVTALEAQLMARQPPPMYVAPLPAVIAPAPPLPPAPRVAHAPVALAPRRAARSPSPSESSEVAQHKAKKTKQRSCQRERSRSRSRSPSPSPSPSIDRSKGHSKRHRSASPSDGEGSIRLVRERARAKKARAAARATRSAEQGREQ